MATLPRALAAAWILVAAAACGGGAASSSSSSAANASGGGRHAPLLRLGHYSSGDGMVGFVLDRTGSPPKMRLDGTTEVLPLEVRRTSARSYDLVNHERHIGLSVDDDGSVIYSKRGGGPNREMYLDAEADPL
jgi:hypothetical protein